MKATLIFISVFIGVSISVFISAPKAEALALRNTSNNLGLVAYYSLNEGTSTKVYPVSASNGATDFSGNVV